MNTSNLHVRAIAAVAAVALSGCAATGRISQSDDQRAASANTAVVAAVPQSQINKAFTPSTTGQAAAAGAAAVPGLGIFLAAAAGAAGAAVDAAVNAERAKKAEEEVLPLRSSMAEFNFDDALRAELDQELSALNWLSPAPSQVSKDPAAKIDAFSATGPQLNVATSYFVSEDLGSLVVRVTALHMPKHVVPAPPAKKTKSTQTNRRVAPPKPVYRNTIVFTALLPTATNKAAADRMAAWQQGDGQALATTVLASAADTIAKELAQDINATPDDVKKQLADKNLADHRLRPKGQPQGKIVSKADNRTVIRHKDGSISINVQL